MWLAYEWLGLRILPENESDWPLSLDPGGMWIGYQSKANRSHKIFEGRLTDRASIYIFKARGRVVLFKEVRFQVFARIKKAGLYFCTTGLPVQFLLITRCTMRDQLRKTLQHRLAILRDEMPFFPEDMRMDPKQLLKETIEQDLAIAKVDGNKREIAEHELSLSLVDELA